MDLIIKDLTQRYTTKRYDASKRVSAEDLGVLLEAIRLSPSSINAQPWRFIVIESDEAKQRFNKTFAQKFQFNQKHVFEGSHIILFAHNPAYTREDYARVVDQGIEDGRTQPEEREAAFAGFVFAEMNTNEQGDTSTWTRAQTYLAFGNALHTLARLNIDSTALEGIDSELISEEFSEELQGHVCSVALVIGYRRLDDYNALLPKSRLKPEDMIVKL